MQNDLFETDFVKERRILIAFFLGEIFLLFFGLVFSLTSNTFGNAVTFTFSGVGIILLGIIFLILFRNYHNLSIVKRKNLLLDQHSQETQALEKVHLQQKEVETKRSDLYREKEQASLSRRRKHEQLESEFSQELARINQSEKDAYVVELSNLQSQYINTGMRSVIIPITEIPGIGSKTKDLLHHHGIDTAYDIEYNRILKIPGIGEVKTQSLVGWGLSIANHYRSTKPTVLPRETINEIQKKHNNLRIGVEAAKRKENIDFPSDLDIIELEYLKKHTQNDETEKSLDEEARKNRLKLHELHEELETYKRISFRLFLIDSIKSFDQTFNVSRKRALTSLVLITIFLISSLCILGGKSTAAIVQSIIPTFTPTATVTFTPTITHTPTYTFTPTNSCTPTTSLTPSKTSTVTKTPTFTRTVTVTRTNTRTRLPTATYNPNAIIPIVPIVPVAPGVCPQGAMAICADGSVSYSQNRRGTCSHHGGVAKWCQ